MLGTTRDLVLPTAITGLYPRPLWYDASLGGRSFKLDSNGAVCQSESPKPFRDFVDL